MNLLKKNYETIKDGPKEIDWFEYFHIVEEEYSEIMKNHGDDESIFQSFFEQNPSMIPGALELFGHSGHAPHMNALITQPTIGTDLERKPDFMWLAQDSLTFCPVFVEIERPNKKMFTRSNVPSAEFNQAMNQIDEWRMILNKPLNQMAFMDRYNIPQNTRDKVFEPQFLLVYGRRSEYENNEYLRNLRKEKERDLISIMSFDRLSPNPNCSFFVTCKVNNKKYEVISIPPTFRYIAGFSEELYMWSNFLERIDSMKHTTNKRKQFLKRRYDYWTSFKGNPPGIIIGMDGE